ncbi:MAG: radical SAM protein, partial [Cyanobacteriota bacterium]
MAAKISSLHFALKVFSRCNLSCRYCYVYNKADHSWQDRPFVMSDTIFEAALDRIRNHCLRSQQRSVRIVFHGGEPCLSGVERFSNWCRRIR